MSRYGLGVDTGGTFTDAVIMDMSSRKVLFKAKSPTTHDDLSIGLMNSIRSVFQNSDISPGDIDLIGVSTTLATNSVLEGKGGDVGLIFIGWDPKKEVHFGEKNQAFVKGGFNSRGGMLHALDEKEVEEAIKKVSVGVKAIAISGLFSIINPSQEIKVKQMVSQITGLPTVAGHELSSTLGIDERARTAVLNGRLIPVINEFYDGLLSTFKEIGLDAPVMVYKGDGSVMNISRARMYPVESVFSGPAASSAGGHILSGKDDFIMVDIGGTSTDIALIESGLPEICENGANICGWKTHVRAVDMYTMALGGDSRIALRDAVIDLGNGVIIPFFSISKHKSFNFVIGPERVVPLCVFTERYPSIIRTMDENSKLDFYAVTEDFDIASLPDKESRIAQCLIKNGPMGKIDLIRNVPGLWAIDEEIESMKSKGALIHSSLTPTDLMVYKGYFDFGNRDGTVAALESLGEILLMDAGTVADRLLDMIHSQIAEAILTRLLDDRLYDWDSPQSRKMVREMASVKREKGFTILPRIDVPIVGIGAPTRHMMGDMQKRLGVEMIFPENSDVGNAVGAVCSKVMESLKAVITPDDHGQFYLNVPYRDPSHHANLQLALETAESQLRDHFKIKMAQNDVSEYQCSFKVQRFKTTNQGVMNISELDHVDVTGFAVGDPLLKNF